MSNIINALYSVEKTYNYLRGSDSAQLVYTYRFCFLPHHDPFGRHHDKPVEYKLTWKPNEVELRRVNSIDFTCIKRNNEWFIGKRHELIFDKFVDAAEIVRREFEGVCY